MKADVKGYGRGRRVDIRKACGRLDLRADNEADAALLAGLASALFYGPEEINERLGKVIKDAYAAENGLVAEAAN